ncbi:MAG: DUF4442 domain-containing protein [Bacteroidia bacterium]
MIRPEDLMRKAQDSAFYRWVLNRALWRMIPFNGPHKFRITGISSDNIELTIPYIRKNLNHIRGIHACALATACEYVSGLSLTRSFNPDQYRIILKTIQMDYHYQGKMNLYSRFGIETATIETLKQSLQQEDAVFHTFDVNIHDTENNHICTGHITWQIKPWSKAKVK